MAERAVGSAVAAQEQTEAYIRSVASGGTSPTDEIARAKALLDSGAITQEEYDALKARVLSFA